MMKNISININSNINFTNNTKNRYSNAYDLAIKSGVFSIEQYTAKQENLTHKNISKQEFLSNVNNIIENTFSQTKKMGSFLLYKADKHISTKLLKKLKLERLKMDFDNETKPLPYRENDSYLIHPRNNIKYIIGENTNKNFCNIKNLTKLYSKVPVKKLLINKNNILRQLSVYTNYNFFPDNTFYNNELQNLQNLADKFDAITNILIKKHIFTENIEYLLYSNISKELKIGSFLPNKDKIIDFSQIYNKKNKSYQKTFITTTKTDRGIRFKTYLYDDIIDNITKYRKQYNHFINTNNIKEINNLNNKMYSIIKNSEIAEVYIEICDKNEIQKKMNESGLINPKNIETLLENENKFYYIKNLKNFNNKIFYNSSHSLIKALKKFGENNNIKKGFLEALAFNNSKHSPVALYLKVGCKPISENEEILKAKISKGFDYKKNVWFVYNT